MVLARNYNYNHLQIVIQDLPQAIDDAIKVRVHVLCQTNSKKTSAGLE
jgi:hypothetical protein